MPQLEKCFYRSDGEFMFAKDMLKARDYSSDLIYMVTKVYAKSLEIIEHPERFDLGNSDQKFVIDTILVPSEYEPGHFYIHACYCNGEVCIYGAPFIPRVQDATSVLDDVMDETFDKSLIWISYCPNARDHGYPVFIKSKKPWRVQ